MTKENQKDKPQYTFKSYNKIWIALKRSKERNAKDTEDLAKIRQIIIKMWHRHKKP